MGTPIDLAIIRAGELRISHQQRLYDDTPLLARIRDEWGQRLANAVRALPRFDFEPPRSSEDPALPPVPPPMTSMNPFPATGQSQQQ